MSDDTQRVVEPQEFVWSRHLPMSIVPRMTLTEFVLQLDQLKNPVKYLPPQPAEDE